MCSGGVSADGRKAGTPAEWWCPAIEAAKLVKKCEKAEPYRKKIKRDEKKAPKENVVICVSDGQI